ncbi:MAG: hypothetical protein AAF939_00915 [Planctomycetota bacterium]
MKTSILFLALNFFAIIASGLNADEPAEKFLEALRDAGYYDVALDYLKEAETSKLVNPEFKKEIPFERAQVLISSVRSSRDRDEINTRLDQAQALLAQYAKNNQSLKVSGKTLRFQGNLLYLRASSQLSQTESDRMTVSEKEEIYKVARKLLKDSYEAYSKSKSQIRRLIDPNSEDAIILDAEDPTTIRDRNLYQNLYTDVRVAIPMVAEKLGDTYPDNSPERRKELEKAADEYVDVYNDYRRFLSGLRACVYAARCNQKLGKHKAALDLLENIFELGNNSAIKSLKLESYVLACESWKQTKPYPFNKAIKLLEPAVSVLNRMEIRNPDWLRVQLELAQAKKAKSDAIKEKGGPKANQESKAMLRAAGKVLRNVARTPSEYRDTARDLLSDWDISVSEVASEVVVPKTFDDARQAGKDTIGEIEILLADLGQARKKVAASSDPTVKAQAQRGLDGLQNQISELTETALTQLNTALEFADEETIRADINNIRYLQAFCYFVNQQYFESAIISEFLLNKYPTVDGTRQAMNLLIQSYSVMMDQADPDERDFEKEKLTSVCNAVIDRWPGSNQAGSAAGTMTRLSINNKNYDVAEKFFLKIPESSSARGPLAVRLGQRLFRDYLAKLKSGSDPTTLQSMLNNAKTYMAEGVKAASLDSLDYDTATGSLFLVDAYLESGDVDAAVNQLENVSLAPLTLVAKKHPAVSGRYADAYSRETYKTAIKVYLAAMKKADDKRVWIDKANGIISGMQETAEKSNDPADGNRLAIVYRMMAKELLSGFNTIDDEGKKKEFANILASFLESVEKESDDAKTVLWAGSTLLSVANQLVQDGLQAEAKPKFNQANSALTRAEKMGFQGDPQEKQLGIELKRQRALALRGTGDFEGALEQFVAIIQSTGPAINLQIDATETVQMAAKAAKRPKGYVEAIKGAKPVKDPKTKRTKKLIWGWEKLFLATRGKEKFQNTYFQALYHIVECRLEYGILLKNTKAIKSAGKEIENQRERDPTFAGSAEWKKKFDDLEKRIKSSGG